MKSCLLLLFLGLVTCHRAEPDASSSEPLSIAPPSYLVLAQRALMAQAEFDTTSLAGLLADSLWMSPAEGPVYWQGKARVLMDWQRAQRQSGLVRMQLSELTHLPIYSRQPLAFTGQPGVYVVSYCQAWLEYRDGRSSQQLLHNCYHFDADRRIDYMLFSPSP